MAKKAFFTKENYSHPDAWRDRNHFNVVQIMEKRLNARDGIRTQELLRDQALNLTPLTWLGYPRACIHYV
jgi:hypothetical protein